MTTEDHGPPASARRLHWPDCRNVRDLGGLPTTDGGRIRVAALIRADSPHRLTAAGVAAVRAYGIARVVDLRSTVEAAAHPGPFAADPMYRLLPMIDPAREAERDRAAEATLAAVYRASVTRNAGHIVAGVAAIADAPPGGVLVHCAVGKDRTGMAVALALRVAGVPEEAIATDYAYTVFCLRAEFEAEMAGAADEATRRELREWQASPPGAILAMLAHVDRTHGSVARYLLNHGLSPAQLTRLRNRLVREGSPRYR